MRYEQCRGCVDNRRRSVILTDDDRHAEPTDDVEHPITDHDLTRRVCADRTAEARSVASWPWADDRTGPDSTWSA